jgi:hypothetical protein
MTWANMTQKHYPRAMNMTHELPHEREQCPKFTLELVQRIPCSDVYTRRYTKPHPGDVQGGCKM